MYLAPSQPDIRLTENLLSLNSGSQKISLVKIIMMYYSDIVINHNYILYYVVW